MSALPDMFDRCAASVPHQPPFLRIPPFPGRKVHSVARLPQTLGDSVSLAQSMALVRELRVGGTFWAAQPALPPSYFLIRSAVAPLPFDSLLEPRSRILRWIPKSASAPPQTPYVIGEADPWHMLSGAVALVCDDCDELRYVAAILGVATYLIDPNGGPSVRWAGDVEVLLADALPNTACFANPFSGGGMTLVEMIELCGFWRSLIDANRPIGRGVGFAFWKQEQVLPLLWGGGESSTFFGSSPVENPTDMIAIWRSKAPPGVIERLERQDIPLVEVEDGFLRSHGLGADCVPPLSITVDRLGAYFDPSGPSELENLIQNGCFTEKLIERARRLRETVVTAGLGKYDRGTATMERFDAKRRHILVPGQVEDDRSVMTGGSGLESNLELLKRVRAREPDAYVIYKPHPDVVAGHRKGEISADVCSHLADKIVTGATISSLIAMVDEVHVNTSLAGFEALMRGRLVTTYGVPFYAGWGLTTDLGPVPARRTAKRTLDELVAATLLIYPRYLDPITGLPCPAEVVVDRLCADTARGDGLLVAVRRLQGKLKRQLQRLGR